MDIEFIQEVKATGGVYTGSSSGYMIQATDADIWNTGGGGRNL